jgi:hypothetical protein
MKILLGIMLSDFDLEYIEYINFSLLNNCSEAKRLYSYFKIDSDSAVYTAVKIKLKRSKEYI